MSAREWMALSMDNFQLLQHQNYVQDYAPTPLLPPIAQIHQELSSDELSITSVDTVRRLQLEINLFRAEIADRRQTCTYEDEAPVKTALSGGWQIVSSSNMDEFLARRAGPLLEDLIFQQAQEHFEFNEDFVTMFEQIGTQRYHHRTVRLSEPICHGKISSGTFINGGSLKTIYHLDVNNGDEKYEERFIDGNGRLHIVIKRFGLTCTRIYQRMGSLQTQLPPEPLPVKRDPSKKSISKSRKALQKLFNPGNHRKFPYHLATNIESRIVGLWREIGSLRVISIKVQGAKYMTRWSYSSPYTLYIFNEKNGVNECKVTVEENRIIMRKGDDWWREKSIVNGKLIINHFDNSVFRNKWVYERIGDPLPL